MAQPEKLRQQWIDALSSINEELQCMQEGTPEAETLRGQRIAYHIILTNSGSTCEELKELLREEIKQFLMRQTLPKPSHPCRAEAIITTWKLCIAQLNDVPYHLANFFGTFSLWVYNQQPDRLDAHTQAFERMTKKALLEKLTAFDQAHTCKMRDRKWLILSTLVEHLRRAENREWLEHTKE